MFCYYVNRISSVSIFGRGGIRTSNCVYFTRPASVEFPLFLLASQRSTPIRDWPLPHDSICGRLVNCEWKIMFDMFLQKPLYVIIMCGLIMVGLYVF